ncbi:MAG: hypothetical protein QOH47_970 [Sphingomonadales bacterium]|jgi:hypothetical protein|nr:hypothetical protein [Sphingomonadales bacterium]
MTKSTKRAAERKPAKAPASKAAAKVRNPRAAKPRKAKPKPEIIRRKLVWRGVLIAIQYAPEGCGFSARLELRVTAPEGVPIPVTESGYRSHHVYPFQVKSVGGPVAYVRKWLDQEARSLAYRRALDRWRQLDLFAALEA